MTAPGQRDDTNPYRYLATADILTRLELCRWDLAEIERDLASDPNAWAHPEGTTQFVCCHVEWATEELTRRHDLRTQSSAPRWPHTFRRRQAEAEEIKSRLLIPDYLHAKGIVIVQRGRRHTCRCPLPGHDDPNPSVSIHADGRLWKCFGCQRGGDIFSLHMFMNGHNDFSRAVTELKDELRTADLYWSSADEQRA